MVGADFALLEVGSDVAIRVYGLHRLSLALEQNAPQFERLGLFDRRLKHTDERAPPEESESRRT